MTMHVRPHLDNALHRYNSDDGTLWFDPFGSIVSVPSTCLSPQQKYVPKQNIGACDGTVINSYPSMNGSRLNQSLLSP
jgi:hypothetical protein